MGGIPQHNQNNSFCNREPFGSIITQNLPRNEQNLLTNITTSHAVNRGKRLTYLG